MQQFRASAFYTVVHWQKLGKVGSECTSHNSTVLAICVPKISKFGEDLTTFWQKRFGPFFGPPYILSQTAPSTQQWQVTSTWSQVSNSDLVVNASASRIHDAQSGPIKSKPWVFRRNRGRCKRFVLLLHMSVCLSVSHNRALCLNRSNL